MCNVIHRVHICSSAKQGCARTNVRYHSLQVGLVDLELVSRVYHLDDASVEILHLLHHCLELVVALS